MFAIPTARDGKKRDAQDFPRLTPMERNLLSLTLLGQTPPEIAASLELSLPEVEAALDLLQQRFGVSSHRKLLLHALLQGWSQPLQ